VHAIRSARMHSPILLSTPRRSGDLRLLAHYHLTDKGLIYGVHLHGGPRTKLTVANQKQLGKLFAGPRTRTFAIIVDDLGAAAPNGKVDKAGWSDDFTAFVLAALRDHHLEPASLVLEVTEGLLLQERSRETLRELRAQGVRVAIDDFGTGYSSLSYLRELPVDMVKIDQAFVSSVESGVADLAFLEAIIRLAETLHLATIAEGIETPTQLDQLKTTGCAYGQGYLLARPGPIASIPATLPALRSAHSRES
jgi:hypothetical protein